MFFMFFSQHRTSYFTSYILFLFALVMAQSAQLSGWFSRISDTMIGLIPFRVWLSDLLHRGEFPLWYPYVNPGFTLTTLHFSSNFTNPLGILLSSLFVYDTTTYNIEELLTFIIGYTGQFLLAASYRSTGWFAGPAAISYVLSSPVLQSRHAGICLPAFMYFPWILFSFRALVHSKLFLKKLAFIFSASFFSFLLIISSYPGLYFYAVFFALIYFLTELFSCDRKNIVLNLLVSAIGLLFFIGLMSPYIYANIHFQTPAIFDGLPRNTIDANDYALHWYDISSLFLPNDIFEPNSYLFLNESNRLYFGLFPAVFFFGYIKNIIFQKISFRYIYLIRILSIYLAIIFVYYSQITPTVYSNKYDIAFIQTLIAFSIGIIFFPRLRSSITINYRLFLIFVITLIFTIDNIFIHHVREQVFPFSQIRHTYYVSGFCLCFFSLLGYDLLSQSLETNIIPQTIRFTKELLVFVLLYSLFILTIQYYNSQMIIPDQYEPSFSLTTQIHIPRFLMWLLAIFTLVLLYLSTVWHKASPRVFISIFVFNICTVLYLSFSFFDYQWLHVSANILLLFSFTIIHVVIFIFVFLHAISNILSIQYNLFIISIFVMDSIGGSFLIGINRDSFDNRLDAGRGIRAFQSSVATNVIHCRLYTSPSPRDRTRSRMPSSA